MQGVAGAGCCGGVMAGYRIVGIVYLVLGALLLTATLALVSVREFREPAACGHLGRAEPEGTIGMGFTPTRSAWPLGIACTYEVQGGGTETVHPSWTATGVAVIAVTAAVGGTVLALLPQRREANR